MDAPWSAPLPRPEPFLRQSVPTSYGLVRPRLLRKLDRLLDVPLGMVLAGPGTGKTTLVADWARRVAADVVWSREPGERPGAVGRIAAGLHAVRPEVPAASDPAGLLDALQRIEGPVVFVLDDLPTLAGPEVAELEWLLQRFPEQVHVLLSSRARQPVNVARTELSATVINVDDLRFRPNEIVSLFREVYGVPLGADDAFRVTGSTGGWAALLHLLATTVEDLAPDEQLTAVCNREVAALASRDYISQQVLAALPTEFVAFMRDTAVLETLTQPRCEGLVGPERTVQLGDLVTSTGLVRSNPGRPGVRVEPALRAHLVDMLRAAEGDAAANAVFVTAGRLARAEGAIDEAVSCHAHASDWEGVRELVREHPGSVLRGSSADWLDLVPEGLFEVDAPLRLMLAVRALRDGRLEAARGHLDDCLPHLADDPTRALAESMSRYVRTWTTGDLQPEDAWTEHLRAALRRPHPHDGLSSSPQAHLVRALTAALAGDLVTAKHLLAGCMGLLVDDPPAALAAGLASFVLGPPQPDRAAELANRAADLGRPWLARLMSALATVHRHLEGGEPVPGDLFLREVAEADSREDEWGAALLVGMRCVTLMVVGRPSPTDFEDACIRFRRLEAPALEAWARVGAALTAAVAQVPDATREAQSAESFALAVGVPGAVAVANAAQALANPGHYHELLPLAEAEAARAGFTLAPWRWVVPEAEPGTHVVDPSRAPYAVACLGRFAFEVDGVPADLRRLRPRAKSLLRLLAVQAGRSVNREVITEALWPDLDAEPARHNLHVAISSLRSVLEPGARRGENRLVVRHGESYLLSLPEGSFWDLVEFDNRLAEADAARAAGDLDQATALFEVVVDLYEGDVLPDEGAVEWVLGPREQYRPRMARAAAHLGELHLTAGSPEAAAAAALRSLDVDPCRDGSWRLLIAAHGAAGDLAAAERARRSYAQVLDSLGVVSDSASLVIPRPREG